MAPRRVLVVDDSMETGRLVQAALATLNIPIQVTLVPSAEEAQLEYSRHAFDLLVSDVRLPGISGLELTRRMRTRHKAVRIIQISGLSDATLKQQAIDAGADYFFSKPLAMPIFLETVEQLLASKKTGPLSPAGQVSPPVSRGTKPLAGPRPPSQADRLADYLSALRQSLGAQGVALLDDQGHPLFHDGELPEKDLDPAVWPALVAALAAGEKVALYLGYRLPESVQIYRGKVFNLVASPLGGAFVVLLVFRVTRSSLRLAIASDEILAARKELEQILADMGVAVHPQAPGQSPERASENLRVSARSVSRAVESSSPAAVSPGDTSSLPAEPPHPAPLAPAAAPAAAVSAAEPASPAKSPAADSEQESAADERMAADLDKLLNGGGETKIDPSEANSFWETLVEKGEVKRPLSPDTLTYEQARQMGLAPEDPKPDS